MQLQRHRGKRERGAGSGLSLSCDGCANTAKGIGKHSSHKMPQIPGCSLCQLRRPTKAASPSPSSPPLLMMLRSTDEQGPNCGLCRLWTVLDINVALSEWQMKVINQREQLREREREREKQKQRWRPDQRQEKMWRIQYAHVRCLMAYDDYDCVFRANTVSSCRCCCCCGRIKGASQLAERERAKAPFIALGRPFCQLHAIYPTQAISLSPSLTLSVSLLLSHPA